MVGPRRVTYTPPVAEEFEDALYASEQAPKCQGREAEFTDYSVRPTPAEAEVLCAGCPLLELCGRYALETRVFHGVWGGLVFHEGEQVEAPSEISAKLVG